jgi:hypothetical protein
MKRVTVLTSVLLGFGCSRGAPPTPAGIDAAVAPMPPPVGSPAPIASASATASVVATAITDAGDPGKLPQTRDKPPSASPALEARAKALWDGIAEDDPDRAMPFFFPVSAYEQVKDTGNPASDWRHRLVSAYKRDIHGLKKRLGNHTNAKFVRLEIPDDRAKWVDPGEEWNKLGYWRVYGTHIVYDVDGKERSFDISSLISWRGEWYVVHLTGFK